MWLFFRDSFLSVVAHRDNKEMLLVRARFQGDIERIFRKVITSAEVIHTPLADYAYRAAIPRRLVADALVEEMMVMDYHNVKDAVDETFRHDAMMDVWAAMLRAQREQLDAPFE